MRMISVQEARTPRRPITAPLSTQLPRALNSKPREKPRETSTSDRTSSTIFNNSRTRRPIIPPRGVDSRGEKASPPGDTEASPRSRHVHPLLCPATSPVWFVITKEKKSFQRAAAQGARKVEDHMGNEGVFNARRDIVPRLDYFGLIMSD